MVLKSKLVSPNLHVRGRVRAFLDAHPGFVPDGWPSADQPPLPPPARVEEAEQARRAARRLLRQPAQVDAMGLLGGIGGMGDIGFGGFGFGVQPAFHDLEAVGGFGLGLIPPPLMHVPLGMLRVPPPPHRLYREVPTLVIIFAASCLVCLHAYGLAVAAFLALVSLCLTYTMVRAVLVISLSAADSSLPHSCTYPTSAPSVRMTATSSSPSAFLARFRSRWFWFFPT